MTKEQVLSSISTLVEQNVVSIESKFYVQREAFRKARFSPPSYAIFIMAESMRCSLLAIQVTTC